MSQKYTDSRYPEKINDLIDNEGNVNPEIIPPAPSGGTKLYRHELASDTVSCTIISLDQVLTAESIILGYKAGANSPTEDKAITLSWRTWSANPTLVIKTYDGTSYGSWSIPATPDHDTVTEL